MAQEKVFENKIKDWLKKQNCYHVKFFANSFTKTGVPDILACVNGHFVGIEVKAQNGKPSELQYYNIRKIRESGGLAYIVYPSGWEEFKQILKGIMKDDFSIERKEVIK